LSSYGQWRTKGHTGIYTPKLPKLDLTIDAEYAANLVNVNRWLYKRVTVQFVMGTLNPHNDIFLTDIIGYDPL